MHFQLTTRTYERHKQCLKCLMTPTVYVNVNVLSGIKLYPHLIPLIFIRVDIPINFEISVLIDRISVEISVQSIQFHRYLIETTNSLAMHVSFQ